MMTRQNLILLLLAAIIAFGPLALEADFGGADDKVQTVVSEINPAYQPWFKALWTPPSTEVESFLFALQAALGAGFIGYFIGYRRGRQRVSD